MNLTYTEFLPSTEQDKLADFLASEIWPFHVNEQLTVLRAHELINDGLFSGESNMTFWIHLDDEDVGIIRLTDMDDLDDGHPLFDLRLKKEFRGRGIGAHAIQWMCDFLFNGWPSLDRIEGTTRADNMPMQKLFMKCLFAKEGHHREAWPAADGRVYDSVRFSLLKKDWVAGTITPVKF